MDLKALGKQAEVILRRNSPAILTAIGVSGTITTAYLSAKASFKAAKMIEYDQRVTQGKLIKEPIDKKEAIKLVWKCYIPPVVTGTLTIASIVFATKINNRRTAAMAAAYSLSERAFIEYKDKVVETIGKNKEQAVRDDIAADKVRATAPGSEVILAGSGDVLCCELHTGRYFKSDMESLRKAQNDINARLIRETYANVSEFYYVMKWPYTSASSDYGWTSDRMLELEFSTVLTNDGRPCLAFEYNYIKPL